MKGPLMGATYLFGLTFAISLYVTHDSYLARRMYVFMCDVCVMCLAVSLYYRVLYQYQFTLPYPYLYCTAQVQHHNIRQTAALSW